MQRRPTPSDPKNKPHETTHSPVAPEVDRAKKEQKEVAGNHKNDGQKPFKGAR